MPGVDAVRAGWGVCEIVAAPQIARAELGHRPDRETVTALRVLGVRQVAQGVILSRTTSRGAHLLGTVADVLHAASMILVILASPTRRRAAVIDGVIASALAVGELRRGGRSRRRR